MAPFKFPPPPPPPPPKAPSNDAPNPYNSQRGGSGRGRGDRGRGRGGGGRGRGNNNSQSRGGHHQDVPSRGRGGHGGQQHNTGYQSHNTPNAQYHGQQQYQQNAPQSSPYSNSAPNPAAMSNPPYGNLPASGIPQSPLDPGAFAQAMAFMSTPVGMQTMNAFATHMAGTNVPQSYPQTQLAQAQATHDQPPSPQSSRKRKRNERGSEWQASQNAQQRGQKPPRAKAAPAPSVPSFGFSLPTTAAQPPPPSSTSGNRNSNVKRAVNLGLTHMDEDSGSEEEDDEDEMETLAKNFKGNGIVFEHEGVSISLQTPAEVAAWIKDRRKNYPTAKRIAEKEEENEKKRASELEFLRKFTDKPKKKKTEPRKEDTKKPSKAKQANLDKLRQKVKDSMSLKKAQTSTEAKQQAVDLGLGYGSDSASNADEDDDASSVLSDSSVLSSSSDDDSDSSDSDAPPTPQTSKISKAPIVAPPPPPAKKDDASQSDKKSKPCYQFQQTGKCKYGRNCHYSHSTEEPKRVGLFERMVEQELEKSDQLALEAIKYLGMNGYLG